MSIRQLVRSGRHKLVVVGTAKTGYKLAGQSSDKELSRFGETFPRQGDAIAAGLEKYGAKATPVYPSKLAVA